MYKNHSHIGSTGKFAISSFRGLGQGPMIFDSSSACINEANSLKSFYSSIPQTNSIYHSHEVKGEGDQYSHQHHSDKLVKHDFKYYCFQSSSIDFDATEFKDVWYMKAIILEKTRYPIGWGETDCKPKKKKMEIAEIIIPIIQADFTQIQILLIYIKDYTSQDSIHIINVS